MKFYILSDLHLSYDTKWESEKPQYKEFFRLLRSMHSSMDKILIIFTGDIIDGGKVEAFSTVKEVLDHLKTELSGFQVQFEFLPGNHDLCDGNLKIFDQFIEGYQSQAAGFASCIVQARVYEGVNFIFANSLLHRDYRRAGILDMEKVQAAAKPGMENILLLHHSFVMEYGDEHTDIEHSLTNVRLLEKAGIGFVINGHTHKENSYSYGNIQFIGCGSFSKDMKDMPCIYNEFLLGEIRDKRVTGIMSYIYKEDASRYIQNQIYPVTQVKYADPFEVQKISVEPVRDYISRKLWPHAVAARVAWEWAFSKDSRITLVQALQEHNKILLLGDAGMGKTFELQQLCYLMNNKVDIPIWVTLKNYDNESIEQLLPEQYRKYIINPIHLIWILDGYDELDDDRRRTFHKKLRKYIGEYPNTRILISSRSNFCKAEVENESNTFPDFFVYDLCRLTPEEVKQYLEGRKIEVNDFCASLVSNYLMELESIPFYLKHLADLFVQTGKLPAKADLMDTLISHSFQLDKNKYDEKPDCRLEDQEGALFQALEEVAFAMQLLQTSVLEEQEFQSLFSNQYSLLKYSGIFVKHKKSWQFVHNNFREYLAAKEVSRLQEEDVVKLFAYDDFTIKPNWVNTLSYLVGLRLNWNIFGWLTKYAPNALVKFEPDRINEDMRFRVLKSLFEEYEEKQLWFNDPLCSLRELAEFSQSQIAIKFLLFKISNPMHFRSQDTALRLLTYVTDTYGLEAEMQNTLVSYCRSYPLIRANECRIALVALMKHRLDTDILTEELYHFFGASDVDYIRLGMYEYLNGTNRQDAYVSYYINGIPLNHIGKERIGNEGWELLQGLKKMSTPQSVTKVLEYCGTCEASNQMYNVEEVFEANCHTAANLYRNGELQFYDILFRCFIYAAEHSLNSIESSTIAFYKAIGGTEQFVIEALAYFWKKDRFYYVDTLITQIPEAITYLKQQYENELLYDNEIFHKVVQLYVPSGLQYDEYAALIYKKSGIIITRPERIDYANERKKGSQKFFNMLFDRELAEQMLTELLNLYSNPGLTVKELKDADMPEVRVPRKEHISILYWTILKRSDGMEDIPVADFFHLMYEDSFIFYEAYELLNRDEAVEINTQQIREVERIFHSFVEKGVFSKTHRDGTVGMYTMICVFFIKRFQFSVSKEVLLDLIKQPGWMFSNTYDSQEKYVYLEKLLLPWEICQQVVENLVKHKISGNAREDHLQYCKKYHVLGVKEVAFSICRNVGYKYQDKEEALAYLCEIEDRSAVCEQVLPCASHKMLLHLGHVYQENPPSALVEKMEERCKPISNNPYLAILISMGSHHALSCYIELVRKKNAVPDLKYDRGGPTEAISVIRHISLLPDLEELINILFQPKFMDCDFSGLNVSLRQALLNCAQMDYDATVTMIKKVKCEGADYSELISFCNSLLNQIISDRRKAGDPPFSMSQVKARLDEMRKV